MTSLHIKAVQFKNFRSFSSFKLSARDLNVLVGPNNAGKSTIIAAFRILAEGLRKARTKKPDYLAHGSVRASGYHVPLANVPTSSENIFHNYNEDDLATIRFDISNGNALTLEFPAPGVCYLVYDAQGKPLTGPADFRRYFPIDVAVLPVLGPVEDNEVLVTAETARTSLQSSRASRNFRNIWHHDPSGFEVFSDALAETWPGMSIMKPEADVAASAATLKMFCEENRIARELFWAGFGFQIWCQMLTFFIKNNQACAFVLDEPDTYLHPDMQRRLVSYVKELNAQVFMATHSSEIIAEVDPTDLVIINKTRNHSKRLANADDLRVALGTVGSRLNPSLTQIAKTRRVLFVEGGDYKMLAKIAAQGRFKRAGRRTDFAVLDTGGFNPEKIKNMVTEISNALGEKLLAVAILDKDYRTDKERCECLESLNRSIHWAWVHECKEIENYLLTPESLSRALGRRGAHRELSVMNEEERRSIVVRLLEAALIELKENIRARNTGKRIQEFGINHSSLDMTTKVKKANEEFESLWADPLGRIRAAPGKELLSKLNRLLQAEFQTSLTPAGIIDTMQVEQTPWGLWELLQKIEDFAQTEPGD